jgi:hypothetical protein
VSTVPIGEDGSGDARLVDLNQRVFGISPDRHTSFGIPLRSEVAAVPDVDAPGFQVDVCPLEGHELAPTKAGGNADLNHSIEPLQIGDLTQRISGFQDVRLDGAEELLYVLGSEKGFLLFLFTSQGSNPDVTLKQGRRCVYAVPPSMTDLKAS